MPISHVVRVAVAVALSASFTGLGHAAPTPGTWESAGALPAAGENRLWDIAAVRSRDVWAVGGQDIKDRHGRALALRFDGTKWTEYAVPGDGNDQVFRVAPVGPADVWGAKNGWQDATGGKVGLVRFDGSKWSEVTIAPVAGGTEAGLFDVVPFAPDNVWVIGNTDHANGKPYVQRFDGTKWTVLPAPAGGFYYTLGGDPKNPVIVGNEGGRAAAQRWDGAAWRPMTLPDLGNAYLAHLVERGGNLLAVGSTETARADVRESTPAPRAGSRPVAVELVGGTWVRRDLPAVAGEIATATPDGNGGAWVSGQRSDGAHEPFFLHFDGTRWTEAALGTGLAGKPANFFGITTVPGTRETLAAGGAGEYLTAPANQLAKLTRK
ncbi:hypothetical protein NLX83_32965 [Allokutzneria sp. A3M-2-11 16]|uniref:hypothetical protein n=1 Tax=Allokutzneria sp. A3M-2-11 16 TaxID=2962043 RepID=UPI0020B7A31E|nr:hypothetical protein [Allokutzneria sp. A3M-2-11 16]MCP3804094.1 hypothetical protein [Allokutzneria sp. A3M-2-11 16]